MLSWQNAVRICMLSCVVFGTQLWAVEMTHLFDSARNLGRGGAYVAAFDSDEASRFNAATLAEAKVKFQLRFFGLDGFVGRNTLSTINDLTAVSGSNSSDPFAVLNKFSAKSGQRQFIKAQVSLLSMRIFSFEVSPFAVSQASFELDKNIPQVSWVSDTAYGATFSYATSLFSPSLFFGYTLRPLKRIYVAGQMQVVDMLGFIPPATTNFQKITPVLQGFYLAHDLSMIWRYSPDFRLGATVENLGDTRSASSIAGLPSYKQKINLGLLARFHSWGNSTFDTFADWQDLLNRDEVTFLRRLKLGAEFGRRLFSRDNDLGFLMGVNEGWLSWGLYADLFLVRLDFAQYTTELGEVPGQKGDKRWALSAKTSMTF